MLSLKAVFEKKNQKSAHTISQLQKKLDNYTKRVKDLQNQQYSHHKHPHRQPREMLRDVGQGLRFVILKILKRFIRLLLQSEHKGIWR